MIAIVDALQGGSNFNLKAYGLIVRLLNVDDPLKWAIKSGKSKDGRDFSVNASRIKPSSLGSPSRNFKSGPIIVYPGFESQALAVINAYGNNVRVYQMSSSKNIEIYADLMHKPKAAVLNNGGKADIHKDIYSDAGLTLNTHYVQENSAANINGNSCYTFVSSPHTKPNQVNSSYKTNIANFLQDGGNFLGQCEAVEAYAGLGLLATYQSKNSGGNESYSNHSEPFAQFMDDLRDENCSVIDFKFTSNPGKK